MTPAEKLSFDLEIKLFKEYLLKNDPTALQTIKKVNEKLEKSPKTLKKIKRYL